MFFVDNDKSEMEKIDRKQEIQKWEPRKLKMKVDIQFNLNRYWKSRKEKRLIFSLVWIVETLKHYLFPSPLSFIFRGRFYKIYKA